MEESITVSLIVSTYNWVRALELCLESILRQKTLPSEILIADDGSRHDTLELIQKISAKSPVPIIHVWHEDSGFRLAAIRNKAINKSTKDYIIQIDGDLILHPNFIENHIQMAEKGCFIRGTRVNLRKKETERLFKTGKLSAFTNICSTIREPANALYLPAIAQLLTRKEKSGKKVKGCNISFWRTDIIAVNGYCNDFEGWGHEDAELCTRLVNSGIIKKIVKFTAIVYHMYHPFLSRSNEAYNILALQSAINNRQSWTNNGLKEVGTEDR